jgi:5'(3')-deoxyribonucleotidase
MNEQSKPAEPIALFDMDGTLADFDASMQKKLAELRSPGEDPQADETAFEEVPYVKARRRMIKAQPGFWRDLIPIPLGFQLLEEARAQRFLCQILSKSPRKIPMAAGEKIEWCVKYVPDLPIVLSEDKGLVYGKLLCDDWPEYIERWLGAINIERIFISGAGTEGGAGDWVVNDIEVDGRSQLTMKNLSGALFGTKGVAANPKGATAFSFEGFDPVEYDRELAIIVTYIGSNPEGVPFFASAIGVRPPQRPTIVPFVSGTPLPVLGKTTIGMRLKNAPFQVEHLEIEDGWDWIVNGLRVNGRSQFKQSGDIPGDMFSTTTITAFVSLEACEAGGEIEIDVTYVGVTEGAIFKGQLEGTVIREDLHSPPPDLHVIIRTGDSHEDEVIATCNWRPAITSRKTS